MKLVFDARALADLEGIFDWIAQDSPPTAKIVLERLFSSTELLMTFPFMGHAVRSTGALKRWCHGCPMSWCMRLIQ